MYLICGGRLLLVLFVESQSELSGPVLNNDMKRCTNVSEGCNKETVIESKGVGAVWMRGTCGEEKLSNSL